ncbi:hypothetical protein L1987_81873 [Smallanthus sonchifolius]|uniref:Uncharacterized protein n=1 Tax=Smallanthus sonchifolius TaxID=185202 RepID=A0ACB8YT90_9ASTR|nr:hypothetical protein L1987_81873 [Smallanthus sonchifolius]
MGDEKREALAVKHDFEITCKRFKNWVAKQPLPTFRAAVHVAFSSVIVGGTMARNHAVFQGISFAIEARKMSTQGFSYGVMISFFMGIKVPAGAMSLGLMFALINGGTFKVIKFFLHSPFLARVNFI